MLNEYLQVVYILIYIYVYFICLIKLMLSQTFQHVNRNPGKLDVEMNRCLSLISFLNTKQDKTKRGSETYSTVMSSSEEFTVPVL